MMTLEETIKQLPQTPGIYQYFDKNQKLLYIGKAKNLSNRVKSYFLFTPKLRANTNLSSRIKTMIAQTVSLNYIVVKSENDALILENSLIKQLNPKYNILLRDDKTYPYIFIDYAQPYPRFEITRKILQSKTIKYFGPYSVGAKDIIDSIYDVCKLVQKKGSLKSKKICLYHQIDKCLAPCELPVTKEQYNKELDKAKELIENKNKLITILKDKMEFYAQEMRFEEAAELRDRIDRIQKSHIKSDIDFASKENYDIFAIAHTSTQAAIVRIFMRNGKIISSSHNIIMLHNGFDEDELYERVLVDFYSQNTHPIIAPILIYKTLDSQKIIEQYLSSIFQKKATLFVPKRGKKKTLIELAFLNAQELLKNEKGKDKKVILSEIQELCSLSKTPYRIEVFDNSHMSGVATVGAMIVYDNFNFDKKSYRTYHLKAKDEYAQMRETLSRRVESFSKNSPPDLWILDGGTTLLNLANDILNSFGIALDVIAISKEKIDAKSHRAKGKAKDIIHTLHKSFYLQENDPRLHFIQNLRDEAHRCAINFHKKTKLKIDQESNLLSLQGISQAKIKKLLNHYGTFEMIKSVTIEEISSILNEKDAKIIKNYYK